MVLAGVVGASVLLAGLAWFAPEPVTALALFVGVPVCVIMTGWLLAPGHTAVHGARIRLIDDERGWQVVRTPFNVVLADGSYLAAGGVGRALSERIVRSHVTGSAARAEALALLDRVLAMDRFVHHASGRSTHLDDLTSEGRAVLARHVVDGITRDVELVESRRSPLQRSAQAPYSCAVDARGRR